jgi:hypothetical protein
MKSGCGYTAPMDELEQRIAAHELALSEVVAHLDRARIMKGVKAIWAGSSSESLNGSE